MQNMCYKNGKVLFTMKKKKPELQYDNEDEETVVCRLNNFIEVNSIGIFDATSSQYNLFLEQIEQIEKICFISDDEFIAVMKRGDVKKYTFQGLETVVDV